MEGAEQQRGWSAFLHLTLGSPHETLSGKGENYWFRDDLKLNAFWKQRKESNFRDITHITKVEASPWNDWGKYQTPLAKQLLIELSKINKCSNQSLQRKEKSKPGAWPWTGKPTILLSKLLTCQPIKVSPFIVQKICNHILHPPLLPKSPSWLHLPSYVVLIPSSIIIITALHIHLAPFPSPSSAGKTSAQMSVICLLQAYRRAD